jgi:hypothetical protein
LGVIGVANARVVFAEWCAAQNVNTAMCVVASALPNLASFILVNGFAIIWVINPNDYTQDYVIFIKFSKVRHSQNVIVPVPAVNLYTL